MVMKMLDLFCGTKSVAKVFEKHGWKTITIDFDPQFEPDICTDISLLESLPKVDVIWASPPCTCFSVASIGKHWNRDHTPKTQAAEDAYGLLCHTRNLIRAANPRYWFIENPRGKMRVFMPVEGRETVTYCQYGDFRMKPTDIWHNSPWVPKPACKNGDPCHVSAPRGSKTGTQGMGDAVVKGVIPEQLVEDIYEQVQRKILL